MRKSTASNKHRARCAFFSVAVGATDWILLIVLGARTRPAVPAWTILIGFIAFSMAVKRMGFQVAVEVTHSLVGVVDLAAVIIFGPLTGAVVAGVSGGAYLILTAIRHHRINGRDLVELPLFNSGLKVGMSLLAGWVYESTGGSFGPESSSWLLLGSFAATALAWFSLDHLGWGLREWIEGGRAGLTEFLQSIWRYSLAVELGPLPAAVLIALAYTSFGLPAFLLMALAVVSVGAIIQTMVRSLRRLSSRAGELRTLNEFSGALIAPRLEVEEICDLIHRYSAMVVDTSDFCLTLLDDSGGGAEAVISVQKGRPEGEPPRAPDQDWVNWMLEHREPVLIKDLGDEPLPFALGGPDSSWRSALYVPLLAEKRPIGSLSLGSDQPGRFSEDDERVLSAIANQGASAIVKARLHARERQRARQLAAVSEVSLKVAAILSLEELFADVVGLIKETFGYYHVGIYTVDQDSEELYFRASTDQSGHSAVLDEGESVVGWVAEHAEPVLSNDIDQDWCPRCATTLVETVSELAVPLKVEERVVGVLDVQDDRGGAFDQEDLFIMRTLAAQVAIAVEDARVYAERQEQAWVATALLQVAETVGSLTSPEEVLSSIVRLTPILVGVERCWLLLWDDESQRYVPSESFGLSPELRTRYAQLEYLPGEAPLLDQVRDTDEPILIRASEGDDLIPSQIKDDFGIGAALALPLRAKGEVVGIMIAERTDPKSEFSATTTSVLTGIANQAAMAVESARLYDARRVEAWVSTALLQVSSALEKTTELDEIMSRVISLTIMLAGVDRCAILLVDAGSGDLVPAKVHGLPPERVEEFLGLRFAPGDEPLLDEIREQRAPVAADASRGGTAAPPIVALEYGFDSLLGLPLLAMGEIVGVMLVDCADMPRGMSVRRQGVLSGIASQLATSIENSRLYQESLERARMSQELQVAREIQKSFLPKESPITPGWQICSDWRSAREVGGDFYDFIWLDADHLGLIIADVSDKGVPAAMYMALSRTIMRASATAGRSPREVLERANELLTSDTGSGMFVTLFYGVLDVASGRLSYGRAGHNPPVHFRGARGRPEYLNADGIVLGIVEDAHFEEREVILRPGDLLVLYTDGVTEAIDATEQEFGLERLVRTVESHEESSASAIVEAVNDSVSRFSSGLSQFDDLTLMVIKRDGAIVAE